MLLGCSVPFFILKYVGPKFAGISFLLWQIVPQEPIILLWKSLKIAGDEK
jgi:hypothetical protein